MITQCLKLCCLHHYGGFFLHFKLRNSFYHLFNICLLFLKNILRKRQKYNSLQNIHYKILRDNQNPKSLEKAN